MEEENMIINLFRQLLTAIKNWIKAIIQEETKNPDNGGGTVVPPVDPKPQPEPEPEPEPEVPKCKEGPEIKNIEVRSPRQVVILFHGKDLFTSQLKVKTLSGRVIHEEKIVHANNTPILNLSEDLQDEEYVLEFQATSCSGFDSKNFPGPKTANRPCKENGKILNVTIHE